MRVVISGGTGLVGRELVKSLLADGHKPVVLTRNKEAARALLPFGCEAVDWDPEGGEGGTPAASVFAGAAAVVHLAGTGVADKRWSEARRASILHSRVQGGEAIARAIAALAPDERPQVIVGGSAVGYYGDRADEALTEDSDRGAGFLADVCDVWETSLAGTGSRLVSLRIGVVLARHGGALSRMLPPFRLGLGGRLGSGRQWMSWIHVEDLVRLIRFAIDEPKLSGPVNATSPEPVTNTEFTATLAKALGRPAFFPVPAIALRVVLGELASMLLGGQRVSPTRARDAGFEWQFGELAAALEDTCTDPTHVLEREHWVPADIERVFEFFSDAHNLERLTPPYMRFRVLDVEPAPIQQGTRCRYKLRVRGVPMRWRSVIENWSEPKKFVDRQLSGPYAYWHHTHVFSERDGGTLMVDRVLYRLPLGALGDLVAGPVVKGDLDAIFDHRYKVIEREFGATSAPQP